MLWNVQEYSSLNPFMNNIEQKKMVAILMATYNGEIFLEEQIDSIINQSYTNWKLFILDDLSTDNTLNILMKYAECYKKIEILPNTIKRGAKGAFEYLMTQINGFQYYMFADQDDVWLKDKILLTIKRIKQEETNHPGRPILIHTDLTVVNHDLSILATSFWNYSRIAPCLLQTFYELAVHRLTTGCTIMFNEQARQISLPFSQQALMHDSWVTLAVIAKNGIIQHIDEQTILYRQHAHNTIGAKNMQENYIRNKILNLQLTIKNNIDTLKMARMFHKISLFTYCYYKIRYYYKYNKLK